MIRLLAGLGLLIAAGELVAQNGQTLLLRQPALSADHIAFVYAGDIWVVDLDGSAARRLTSAPEEESWPRFSPDGTTIAYTADFEGNVDVYVIPTAGGQPRRLTWHPGEDHALGWTPDGTAVAMVSRRQTDHGRSAQLFHVGLSGEPPARQMAARVFRGAYDASGERFAYVVHPPGYNGLYGGTAGWKAYRGGAAPKLMIMNIAEQTVANVPNGGSNDLNPLWLDGKLYFTSDRQANIFNVYRYDPADGSITKVADERVWDVRSADGHGSTIVYEAGGRLWRVELPSGATTEIEISIAPDLPQLRAQWKNVSDTIQSVDISASGQRALLTARGEIFTVPIDKGSTRNVSNTGGVREYSAIWSPDGSSIAFVRESLAGQTLIVQDQTGMNEGRSLPLGNYFYELQAWSPGEDPQIVFTDNHLGLSTLSLDDGEVTAVSTGARGEDIDVSISPDGQWLAYTEEQPNYYRDLKLYRFATGERLTVTDGGADVASPAFSRDGRYLYFAASTNSGPLQVGLDMTSQERPYRAGLYALVLAADGESPLLPESGDEPAEDDDTGDSDDADDEESPPVVTRIDVEGIGDRIVALPVAERNYGNLAVDGDGDLYYVQAVQPGASNEPPGETDQSNNLLVRFDFDEREAATVAEDVAGFRISADGDHLLLAKTDETFVSAEIADELELEPLDLADLRVRIEPRQEWRQIFDEAWRMEREYFYAENMHGLDWQAVYERYLPLLAHAGRREDVNELIVEMIAEMQVGHNRIGGGDVYQPERIATGLLGANLSVADGRHRIDRIYAGESWNPFLRAPLATPGNEAVAGEYILAVNGRDMTGNDNLFEALQGTVGNQVTLRVGPRTDGEDSREIVVEPIANEGLLRLWSWVEDNRRAVEAATAGRVGYVYLPNTADEGYEFFNRMFFAQVDKEALIIDERSNGGGQAANYITDVLSRAHLSGWRTRDGQIFNTPAGAVHGPKIMMIDQDAGSGGDYLPYSFRQLGIGRLLGTRTWGGLIGIFANPLLVDGGVLTVPYFRFFDPQSRWSIENEGVAPDIVVELDPIAANAGRDTQLERAIAEILSALEDFEPLVPTEAPPLPTALGQ